MNDFALSISPLATGYLVADANGKHRAALTRFCDLVEWLAEEFGEEPETRGLSASPPDLAAVRRQLEALDVAKPAEQIAREKASANRAVAAMFFDDGASNHEPPGEDDLVKMPPAEEAVSAPIPNAAETAAPSGSPVLPQQSEPARTDPTIPLPSVPMPKPATADPADDLPENHQKVLDHLQLCALKHGERFQIASKILAQKAGVSPSSLFYFIRELERKGLIQVQRQGRGADPFYIVPLPADEDEEEAA